MKIALLGLAFAASLVASQAQAQMSQQQIDNLAIASGFATPTVGGATIPLQEVYRSLLQANGISLPPPPQPPPVYMPFIPPFNCAHGYVTVGNAVVCN